MDLFDKWFKTTRLPTSNPAIINALKQLQTISSSYNERDGALTKLQSLFVTANDINNGVRHALLYFKYGCQGPY